MMYRSVKLIFLQVLTTIRKRSCVAFEFFAQSSIAHCLEVLLSPYVVALAGDKPPTQSLKSDASPLCCNQCPMPCKLMQLRVQGQLKEVKSCSLVAQSGAQHLAWDEYWTGPEMLKMLIGSYLLKYSLRRFSR